MNTFIYKVKRTQVISAPSTPEEEEDEVVSLVGRSCAKYPCGRRGGGWFSSGLELRQVPLRKERRRVVQ